MENSKPIKERLNSKLTALDLHIAKVALTSYLAANDPFVMEAWINSTSEKKIKYLADPNFELLDATGLEIDLTVAGLGKRLSRFAIFIDNGLIKKIFDEEGGGLEKSSAENLLKNL